MYKTELSSVLNYIRDLTDDKKYFLDECLSWDGLRHSFFSRSANALLRIESTFLSLFEKVLSCLFLNC